MKKARPNERPGRTRPEGKRGNAGSGEGAQSALASLREIERARMACEPVEDLSGVALAPTHPAATTPPLR